MEESPERLERISSFPAMAPEIEALVAMGHERAPLVIPDRVDPVVRHLRAHRNVALVGPSGSGKRSLAKSLRRSELWAQRTRAQLTLSLSQGPHRDSWPLYVTTVRHWLDGVFYTGNLSQKISLLMRRTKTDVTVTIEHVYKCVGAFQGRDEKSDLVDLMESIAAHPKIHLVVTATPSEWAALCEAKPDFASQFVVMDISPPNEQQSRAIASYLFGDETTGVRTHSDGAIEEAFTLAARHFPYEGPLGPAMRLLRSATPSSGGFVEVEDIRHACAAAIGVERRWIGRDQLPTVSEIVEELERSVVGQRGACESIAKDLIAGMWGFDTPGRPRSYLFAGPPGVGKTSLACAVQRLLSGRDAIPLRFDCTEYSTPLDALRLQSSQPGSLVTGISLRPGTVVLLDEIDRLHPVGRDLLLQMLGEGRITSRDGTEVHCGSTVVFMTTNEGTSHSRRASEAQREAWIRSACGKMLGAALLSRLTRILVFRPLELRHAIWIVRQELSRITQASSLEDRGIIVRPTKRLVEDLAIAGRVEEGGARGLHKLVRDAVALPIAEFVNDSSDVSGVLSIDTVLEGRELAGVTVAQVADPQFTQNDLLN